MYNHEAFNADLVTDERIAEMNALVESGDIKLNEFRSMYKKATGEDTTLTDDELVFMIAGTDDDQSAETWVAIMQSRATGDEDEDEAEMTAAVTVDRHTANSMKHDAESFGELLDDGFVDTMFDIQEADEKSKRGIAIMLWDRKYGPNKWDDDTWGRIPDLDLTEKEVNDRKLNVKIARWRVKDGNRNRVQDWFEIAISNTKRGAALVKRIDDLIMAQGNEAKTPAQQELSKMSKTDLVTEQSMMESRLRNLVTRLKRMVRLKRRIDAINEFQPKRIVAGLLPKLDKEGNELGLTTTVECLFVQHWSPNGKIMLDNLTFMPNTFLRLDPVEAEKLVKEQEMGHWEALKKTKDRERGPGDADFKVPTSPEKYLGALNSIAHYHEQEASFIAFQKYFGKLENDAEKLEVAESVELAYMKIGGEFNFVKPTLERIRKEMEEQRQREAASGEKKGTPRKLVKAG